MTPRERWQALFRGERPDRVPCDYWGPAEVTSRLLKDLGCCSERELWKRLDIDKCIYLAPRHPRAKEDTWHTPSLFSIWQIETRLIPYGDGLGMYEEVARSPLARANSVADIQGFAWPDPMDWDLSDFRRDCESWAGYPILGASYEPFYLYCRMRGMEQAFEDLVQNPVLVDATMERIFEIHAGIVRRALEAAGELIDFVYVAEDLGTQESLLMSPSTFRRFLKPWLTRMTELVHSYGVKVFHHDDGAIRQLLPDLIDVGIDLLNPIQWRCRGMDRLALARDFGQSFVFHGGVDNQQTLPFGLPHDVRQEISENLRFFRNCRGYIVSPCHNIQANTPTRNIVALYEAVHEFG
ncbi:MAG TPA: uroporphyrinogen decarboxylase family protein [Terriglobia bacterium]|nr:uroporphyrinogen decarboxylase family protein [Terriglobia bacterium]